MKYLQTTLEKDLQGILDVAHVSFHGFYDPDKLLKRVDNKKHWIYVAKDEEKIVGFKIWYEDDDGQIYSWLGAVHPDYRKNGIASHLIDIQFELSKRLGYSKITLKTHKGHPEIIALCNKKGFVETKREPHHWKDTINKEAIFFEYSL